MQQHDTRPDPDPGPVTDDRVDPHLPVTDEVGSEGGSYSDATDQVATFRNDVPRTDGFGGPGSTAAQAIRSPVIANSGVGSAPAPDHGMIRYPTEPPNPPSATEGRRIGSGNWRAGVIGAAAGAAAALSVELLRRRR